MAGKPNIVIGISAQTGGLNRGLKNARGELTGFQKSTRAASIGLGTLVKGFALVGGATAVKNFLSDAIAEAREAQKVTARTNNVIKTTGGVANVTAKQVSKLAESISNKTGIDDEAIQTGSNLLLTFKNIHNEVGKGNKIFDRATQSAVDLSAAGFGSIDSASKMLGKALNDPIRGVTALSRAGVTFTDQQKEQIKTMVKSGDILGAQKLILGEVESQTKGAAAAQATAGEKLRTTVNNIKEDIGARLLPVLDRMATYLAKNLPKWMDAAGKAFSKIKAFIEPVVDAFDSFGDGTSKNGQKLNEFLSTVRSVFASVKSVWSSAVTIIQVLWSKFGSTILNNLRSTFTNILMVVRGAFTVIQGIFNVFAGILTGDWSRVWNGIKQIFSGVITILTGLVRQLWNQISTAFRVGVILVRSVVTGMWGAIKSAFSAGWNAAKSLTTRAWSSLKSAVSSGVKNVISTVKGLPGKMSGALSGAASKLHEIGSNIMAALARGIRGAAGAVLKALGGVVTDAIGWAKKKLHISSPSRVFRDIGAMTAQGLIVGLESENRALKRSVDNMVGTVMAADGRMNLTASVGASASQRDLLTNSVGASGNTTNVTIRVEATPATDKRALGQEIASALDSYVSAGGRVRFV